MAYLDPKEAFDHLQGRVLDGIQTQFPIKGRLQTLYLDKLETVDKAHPDDLRGQHKAKVTGDTFAVPVYAHLTLRENGSEKVIDSRRVRVAEIPKTTSRYSYIVEGQEYQVDNQWQLKPGIYARRRDNGELESHFNVTGKGVRAFDVVLNPDTKVFSMQYGSSKANLPLYPLMKTMGMDDVTLEKTWGKEVFEANKKAPRGDSALATFYKAQKRTDPPTLEDAKNFFHESMTNAQLRPEATELTVGKPFSNVDGDALRLATVKMLKVQSGHPEDDRDSLIFKDLRTTGDYANDMMRTAGRVIQQKVSRKINTAKDVRDVIKFDLFNGPLKDTFTKNSASRIATQINPVEMVAASMQTTVMGKGGIQSERSVNDEAKFVNPSHFGFLDPIHTPEGDKTGVTLRLPIGVKKVGNEARIRLQNLRTGQEELVSAGQFMRSKVVLPDQVRWENGVVHPVNKDGTARMSLANNEIRDAKFSEADYAMPHSWQLFNMTANLIPFLGSTSGGRASMASRQMEQAISLVHREPPLVQVGTGQTSTRTFEKLLGNQASHAAPVDGKVVEVKKDAIILADKDGKHHEVQLYNNYPLNDAKSVLHSTPLVKAGDHVKAGETIADTNYSKNGVLALGTNLRTAYIPFKGYNFEDGIVISESAAKKLSSEHLQKHNIQIDDALVLDKRKFNIEQPGTFTAAQLEKLDASGVVQVGQHVAPGDPLIAAMKLYNLKDRTGLTAIRKSMSGAHTDKSVRWDSEFDGEVVNVHRSKDGIAVHVRTTEPMQVGDKMCFDGATEVLTRLGWKSIGDVTLHDEICTLVAGDIVYQRATHLHSYETGGRMYRIKSQQVDLLVTDNHSMYVRLRGRSAHELVPAVAVAGKRARYAKSGRWAGTEPATFTFPALEVAAGQGGHGRRTLPPVVLPMETYLMLLGMFLSEGNCVDQPRSGSYGIDITQVKEPQRAVLLSTLTAHGVTYSEHGSGEKVRLYSKQLLQHFTQFGHAADKFIPVELFELSPRLLTILFDWLTWGDGHRAAQGARPIAYTTTSRRLADDVQRLCLHIGFAANVTLKKEAGLQSIKGQSYWCQDVYDVRVVTTKLQPQVNHSHTKKQKAQEEYFVENYTAPVYCLTVPGHVVYVRRNGKSVWSGNCGRYGNKGIVTMILPDQEMPHTKDGKHIEVALNPSGVPGRMNVGQLLETAAGKIAQKTGKPYIVTNFEPNTDALAQVQADLKAHGLSDTEELFDPVTKQPLGKVMVGPQHHLKLVHQVEKKLSVRGGMNLPGSQEEHYDLNLQPTSGSGTGGQSMGTLGLYALLAHGATANIREMQTYKSEGPDSQSNPAKRWPSDHDAVWSAIQTGKPLPPPKPTFAFQKFTDMLRASGVNIDKKGHDLILSPLTDDQVKTLAKKELPHPAELLSTKMDKNGALKPRPGGLFDETLTGGHGGRRWTRISLAEPIPNPMFEGPVRSLTGLSSKDFTAIVHGEKGVSANGNLTSTLAGVTGGAGIELLLQHVDVARDLPKAETALKEAKGAGIDKALKKVKYLRALSALNLTPSAAYILHNLPVIPPVMRPVSQLPDGTLKFADVNHLYSNVAKVNDKLKDAFLMRNLTDEGKTDLRKDLYDGTKKVMGLGIPYADADHKGLLHEISGSSPKTGFFQNRIINRRQDLTMRSTIVPEPSLGLDEVGIPKHAALDLFRPFVVRKLKDMGAIPNELAGAAFMAKKSPAVWRALDKVMEERPLLLKRDPALHKYSVQAFKPRAVEGNAIKIHPLVTGGFNADFDGDTMSAFVPISSAAVAEAHKMYPSNNLFSEATGQVMFQPTLESALGLYKLSLTSKDTGKKFAHPGEAIDAVRSGATKVTDIVTVGGKKTTAGRILIASAVPEAMQDHLLHDLDYRIHKSGLSDMLTTLGKNHAPQYGEAVNQLKDLGNGASFGVVTVPKPASAGHGFAFSKLGKTGVATEDAKKNTYVAIGAHTLSLKDFTPDEVVRKHALAEAKVKVDAIYKSSSMTHAQKDVQAIGAYEQAEKAMKKAHEASQDKDPNNLFTMYRAGVKPGWDQYKQMVLAPMIYKDSADRKIPTPVTKSYAEGLDVGGYWTQMHGARRGAVMKVQEVKDPGTMSKLLMNNMMDMLVNEHDCGTTKGVTLPAHEKDVYDRILQQDFTHGKLHIPAGTMLTPDLVGKIRAAKKNAEVLVRSPMKCESEKGICQKCAGLSSGGHPFELGTNIGVHSAHAVGERAIQLTLKAFHTGGVGEQNGSRVLNSFARFESLMNLPKKIPDEASLAMVTGKVEKIEPTATGVDVYIGGRRHHVGKDSAGSLLHKNLPNAEAFDGYQHWNPPVVGGHFEAGDFLSDPNRTFLNPHHLYAATGSMEKVQNHLATEVYKLYKGEGIKRRAVETVIRAMGNLTRVVDPGDHPTLLTGEYRPRSSINKMNQELVKQGLQPIEHKPALKGISVLPLEVQEDWMAKLQHRRLRTTIADAAATGGVSHIHGVHPIPAIAFGSEIGLTSKNSLTPGREHLKDVPAHYY